MEQVHNVNVTVSYTRLSGGDFYRKKYDRENVSLYYAGKTRVYMVEEDGEETISTRPNVLITSENFVVMRPGENVG